LEIGKEKLENRNSRKEIENGGLVGRHFCFLKDPEKSAG